MDNGEHQGTVWDAVARILRLGAQSWRSLPQALSPLADRPSAPQPTRTALMHAHDPLDGPPAPPI